MQQLDIVFYGDSIAETWRGTDMGRNCRRCDGGPDTFQKFFGSRYKANVFAVGGNCSNSTHVSSSAGVIYTWQAGPKDLQPNVMAWKGRHRFALSIFNITLTPAAYISMMLPVLCHTEVQIRWNEIKMGTTFYVGDQTAHLQWRLLNGQLLLQNPPRVVVLMIGTNDLGADAACFKSNTTLALQAVNKIFQR